MNSPDTNTLRLWREAAADYQRMADLALCDEASLELLYWADVFTDLVETAKFENTAPLEAAVRQMNPYNLNTSDLIAHRKQAVVSMQAKRIQNGRIAMGGGGIPPTPKPDYLAITREVAR